MGPSFEGILRKHDLQSRSTDGQRLHVPLQHYPPEKSNPTLEAPLGLHLPIKKAMLPGPLTMPAVRCPESAWLLREAAGTSEEVAWGLALAGWGGPGYTKGRAIKGKGSAVLSAGWVILFNSSGKWELKLGI